MRSTRKWSYFVPSRACRFGVVTGSSTRGSQRAARSAVCKLKHSSGFRDFREGVESVFSEWWAEAPLTGDQSFCRCLGSKVKDFPALISSVTHRYIHRKSFASSKKLSGSGSIPQLSGSQGGRGVKGPHPYLHRGALIAPQS